MKRAIYVFAAALMLFTSCSKDEQPVRIDEVKMVSATINAESTEGQTKTIASKEGNVYKIKWVQDDQLSVFNSKNTEMSKFTSTVSGEAASS
ncbi:MAG: hypothetical protein KBS89_08705, partial [Bacteroidales bacterium]|nr:hypothetical protein [Candidatus Egerieousia equi]